MRTYCLCVTASTAISCLAGCEEDGAPRSALSTHAGLAPATPLHLGQRTIAVLLSTLAEPSLIAAAGVVAPRINTPCHLATWLTQLLRVTCSEHTQAPRPRRHPQMDTDCWHAGARAGARAQQPMSAPSAFEALAGP